MSPIHVVIVIEQDEESKGEFRAPTLVLTDHKVNVTYQKHRESGIKGAVCTNKNTSWYYKVPQIHVKG